MFYMYIFTPIFFKIKKVIDVIRNRLCKFLLSYIQQFLRSTLLRHDVTRLEPKYWRKNSINWSFVTQICPWAKTCIHSNILARVKISLQFCFRRPDPVLCYPLCLYVTMRECWRKTVGKLPQIPLCHSNMSCAKTCQG